MACRMLFLAELVDYSGHISVRIPGTDRFLINGHPISRATVTPDDIVTFNAEGKRLEGKWDLPSELPMHTRTYRARTDVQCVAHLHNRMVVVLSMADRQLIPASNPGALFGQGPIPIYPGSRPDPYERTRRCGGQDFRGPRGRDPTRARIYCRRRVHRMDFRRVH